MELAFSIAQSGITASDIRQNIIADNLANVSTQGFKAKLTEFSNLWNERGARIEGARPNFTLGAPKETEQDTDMYIAGDGFFQVQLDGVMGYTRDGSFRVDSEGNLVNSSGYVLEPGVTVPEDSIGIEVTRDGIVYSIDPDRNAVEVGEIQLARFINPSGLVSIGDNLYVEGVNSGNPLEGTPGEDGIGFLQQRFVEQSNVDPAEELTELIKNNRTYQLNLRVFQGADAIVGRALDLFS